MGGPWACSGMKLPSIWSPNQGMALGGVAALYTPLGDVEEIFNPLGVSLGASES
jgi:hypothetical protein